MSIPIPRAPDKERVPFLNVAVDPLTLSESLESCADAIESRRQAEHVVINAGKCVLAHKDQALARMIQESFLINADGQSIVWAASILGHQLPERVAGIDLMHALLALCTQRGWSVYFLGARQEVLELAIARLEEEYPGLPLAGSANGYYDDSLRTAEAIRDSNARVLFIAMPSPQKESFVAEYRDTLGPLLTFGIGGTLDVVAGVTKRAPGWMQRSGLEWLYRLVQEPSRMWKRYLVGNFRFVVLVLRALFQPK